MNDLPVFQEEDIGQYGKIYKLANKGGVGGNNSLRLFKLYDDGGKERKSGTYMECAYTARKKNLQNFKIREVVETENNFNIKGTGLKESNKVIEKKEKNKTVEGWAKELGIPYEDAHKYWLRAEKKADKSLPEKRYWAEVNSIAQKMLGAKYGEFKSKKESLMKKPTQKPIKESRRIAIVVKSTKNLTESLLCEEDLFNEVVQSIFSDTEDQIDIQGVADMLELERVNGEPMEVEPEEVIAVLEDMGDVTVVEVDSPDEIPELLSDENLGLFDTIEMMADKHAENQYAKVDEDNFTVKQPLQLDNVQPDSDEQILLDDEFLDVYGMQPAMYEYKLKESKEEDLKRFAKDEAGEIFRNNKYDFQNGVLDTLEGDDPEEFKNGLSLAAAELFADNWLEDAEMRDDNQELQHLKNKYGDDIIYDLNSLIYNGLIEIINKSPVKESKYLKSKFKKIK